MSADGGWTDEVVRGGGMPGIQYREIYSTVVQTCRGRETDSDRGADLPTSQGSIPRLDLVVVEPHRGVSGG